MGPFIYGTDGAGYDRLIVPVSGAHAIGVNQSALPEEVGDGGHRRTAANLFMDGPEIFRFAVTTVPGLLKGLLDKAGVTVEEIDRVVFHQANLFMLNYLVKIMKLPPEKVVLELEEVGNTVSTSIPLAIAMAVEKGRIADGARLALLGFGVGYSWSGALVSWRGAR
jgi:3-oxoacyl-[acyl-carrier-protein] synthase-3